MIDIRSDNNVFRLRPILKEASLPQYVADAPLDQLGVDVEVPKASFASTADNTLPCHTKAACFVSTLYFDSQRPGLDSKRASEIEAKLASFRKLHAIEDAEIDPARSLVQAAVAPEPTAQEQAYKLAALASRDANAIPAGDLIEASRELKTAGANAERVMQWCVDWPIADLPNHLQTIANNAKVAGFNEFADKMRAETSRKQVDMIPEAARLLNANIPTRTLLSKLAELPRLQNHPLRIANHDIPHEKVQQALPKIASFTDVPVYSDSLRIPRKNWESAIESATIEQQREVLEYIDA